MNSRPKLSSELADGVVYSAELPARVPWGLHSLFISDEFLENIDHKVKMYMNEESYAKDS